MDTLLRAANADGQGDTEDKDGLEKVQPGTTVWPFAEAKHRGWDYSRERKLGTYNVAVGTILQQQQQQNPTSENIPDRWLGAWIHELNGELWEASEAYCKLIEETNPDSADDFMLYALSHRNLGLLVAGYGQQPVGRVPFWRLLFPMERADDVPKNAAFMEDTRNAVLYFKKGAIKFQLPECKYLYGMALVEGTGGIKRDIAQGVAFLHEAGANRIGEALFELGWIYERGIGSGQNGIEKSISAAIRYYKAAGTAYNFLEDSKENDKVWWLPQIKVVKAFLKIDPWFVVDGGLGGGAVAHFSWSLAGQAFLFGAAATLSGRNDLDHYAPLLLLLPLIGLTMALISFSILTEEMLKAHECSSDLWTMLELKVDAYCRIIKAADRHLEVSNLRPVATDSEKKWEKLISSLSVLESVFNFVGILIPFSGFVVVIAKLLGKTGLSRRLQSLETYVIRAKNKLVVLYYRRMVINFCIQLLAPLFFGAWVVLIVNEASEGCDNWWFNECSRSLSN